MIKDLRARLRENLSSEVRHKLACSATEASKSLKILNIEKRE